MMKKAHFLRKYLSMLNKLIIFNTIWIICLLVNGNLRSQTSEWKVVWDKNAAVDSVDENNETALFYAVRGGNKAVVSLLLDRGASASL